MVDGARADGTAVDRARLTGAHVGQELHVALLHLDGPAEELLVELPALGEIRHVHVEMNLGTHGVPPLAAGSEQARERRHRLPLHRIVDVPLFLPALEQPCPPQRIQVMRQGRPRNLDLRLDLADGHLVLGPHEDEEDLQPRQVGQALKASTCSSVASNRPSGSGAIDFILLRIWNRRDDVKRLLGGLYPLRSDTSGQ